MSITVLAVGAWLKNAACLVLDGRAHWSPVHGDLSDPVACEALERSLQVLLAQAAGVPVRAIAHDLHPDFFSTQLAVQLAATLGVPAIGVQHHHAHIAAVVAEHGIEGAVIGLALDGVGLGTDGQAWGGELLWMHGAQWQRLGHLTPLALPGGDRAAREPWRMAASVLHALGRGDEIATRFAPQVGEAVASGVQQMLAKNLNCPQTSSTGRWFDAAAGALGLSVRQTDEAEAAIALEAAAARCLALHPDTAALPGAVIDAQNRLDLRGLMPALFDATADGVDTAAAGFHLALADALADWATRSALDRGSRDVCLGGGCFFNRILRERITERLQTANLRVHRPIDKGCGDAGLALGQAWVAAQQLAATTAQEQPTKETEPCA
ncbi:carbamoyltransferase HypF [Hydrogenophaga sp.]|jgi:hydrogenase maturation protein HypF|uniref:Kae1-like domain-containing protein n=1 Tax=Hydrogenophaga sp. TaxID=1904254 RepID=UPI0027198D7F|nr:carbamoyltransferase HypF [Hydrogenophaga sp.]MDO9603572.1 carbamoyltransferase HypF [Hydrogenophaga sp.]